MKNQRGSAVGWVMVILVIVAIVGAAYWYWNQNSNQPTPVTSATLPTEKTTKQNLPTTQGSNPQTSSAQEKSSFSAKPLTGVAPLTVHFVALPEATDESITYGDGGSTIKDYGCDPQLESCDMGTEFIHTYAAPGTYTAILYRGKPAVEVAQVTITATYSATKTYTDPNFGFMITYPATFSVALLASSAATHGAYLIDPSEDPRTGAHQINITGDGDVATCLVTPHGSYISDVSTTTIGGAAFLSYQASTTGGVFEGDRYYKTVHNGSCYTIDLFYSTSPSDPLTVYDQIIQSFRFTQ